MLIDIGNTNTSIAIVTGRQIHEKHFIHTAKKRVKPEALRRLLGINLRDIDTIVVVSVVPDFLRIVKQSVRTIAPDAVVLIVGEDIKVPLKVKYKKPKDVGPDRLVTAFGAVKLYGQPVITVDFGTAVTFDYVNSEKEYEGGLIFPGLRLALESLTGNTALLPKIDVKAVKGLIGKSTSGSINKGIVFGYAAMCDGVIKRIKKEYGRGIKVVATGGDAALIARYSTHIKKVSPDLIFEGLFFLMA